MLTVQGAPRTAAGAAGRLLPVQLLRMINATVQSFISAQFKATPNTPGNIQFRQTAQDGVQLAWANYSKQFNGSQPVRMAPANRVDLLIQAPSTKGCSAGSTTPTSRSPGRSNRE